MESSVVVKMTFTSAPMLGSKRCALQGWPRRPHTVEAQRPGCLAALGSHGPASHSFPGP
jgi:hypothetical protein